MEESSSDRHDGRRPPSARKLRRASILAAAVLGLAVLSSAGFALRRTIAGWWHLRQLRETTAAVHPDTLLALGRLGVIEAVPDLVITFEDPSRWPFDPYQDKTLSWISDEFQELEELTEVLGAGGELRALIEIQAGRGEAMVPNLVLVLRRENTPSTYVALRLLAALESPATGALVEVERLATHPAKEIRRLARVVLDAAKASTRKASTEGASRNSESSATARE